MLVLRGDWQRLGDGELPLAPLATALRETPDAVLAALPPAVRSELGVAFPHLSLSGSSPEPPPEADRHAQRRLFDSMWCLLMDLSDRTPVLLVIEDFHWVDRATREFVGFLALGARRERIATVITYRQFDDTPPSTVEMLADLQRIDGVERIDLPALSRAGVETLTRGVRGGRPSARLVDDLHRRSRGNPFFTEQLLAALDGGHDARLPASVTNVVLQRLRHVSPRRNTSSASPRCSGGRLPGICSPPDIDVRRASATASALSRRSVSDLRKMTRSASTRMRARPARTPPR